MAGEGSLFGRIALEKGFVTEGQLARALRFQEEVRALGLPKRLGDILVQDGALDEEKVALVCRLQEKNERSHQDRRFARIAVKNGLATQEQVDHALEAARDGGFQRGVGAILIERGALSSQAARAIQTALDRAASGKKDAARRTESSGMTPVGGTLTTPSTARIGVALVVDPPEGPVDTERRVRDVLFAAVALRDGLVLVPEVERALREQALRHPDEPPLESVLAARGILAPHELAAVAASLEKAQKETLAFPGYRVLDVLGRGATSIVLRARHELIDREVAIKLFRTEHLAAMDADAVVDEARTIAKLRHPNVVGLYDVGRVHRRIYYVMELVDGPTLLDKIKERGFLREDEALARARDVACALDAIHEAGLVHRDVKPLNILIAKDGTAKLTDLGLAREVDRPDSLPAAIFGSPHTLSPEQAQGDPVDIRADIYGLGATLFYSLTGDPPYDGKDPLTVMMKHVTDPVPDPRTRRPEVSEATARLVLRLMAKRREDRPATPREVIAAIDLWRVTP